MRRDIVIICCVNRFVYLYVVFIFLFYCEFLLDATTVGTDDIDTGCTDIRVDCLARLDGEVCYCYTACVNDAYICFTEQ